MAHRGGPLDAAEKAPMISVMRTLLLPLGWLLLAASVFAKPYEAEIAAYDAMLAAVQPGQTPSPERATSFPAIPIKA